jgi:hypothetical protein
MMARDSEKLYDHKSSGRYFGSKSEPHERERGGGDASMSQEHAKSEAERTAGHGPSLDKGKEHGERREGKKEETKVAGHPHEVHERQRREREEMKARHHTERHHMHEEHSLAHENMADRHEEEHEKMAQRHMDELGMGGGETAGAPEAQAGQAAQTAGTQAFGQQQAMPGAA